MNNGEVKWDKNKKAARDADSAKQEALRKVRDHWEDFKRRVKKGVNLNFEQIEAMLVDFQREAHQVCLQLPDDQIAHYRSFTDTMIADARAKLGLKDNVAAQLQKADAIMQANTITQRLPDGSPGETYGFTSTESMLAVPFVAQCNDLDFIGFAMHGTLLCALYEGGLKEPLKVVGVVKHPLKVILPSLVDLAAQFKLKSLEFPEIPKGLSGPEGN